jgi:glyoxylase-like metal-dependent hydrolase (beta-lactamase superfamily II)
MLFETFAAGGCRSYLLGCETSCAAVLIDPELSLTDRYRGRLNQHGLTLRYIVDTHTHADHFSASLALRKAFGAPVAMHRLSAAPFADVRLDDGEMLIAGTLKLTAMHTPGHTHDSMCLVMNDRVFTGDTLLIGGTGRTDLPTGDPHQLFDSLFGKLLKLPGETLVFPAHDYKDRGHSTIADEIGTNPRLQKTDRAAFVDYDMGHIEGALHLPRGQLELRVNSELPDPTMRIVTCCEYGKISVLAAATLRDLGFMRATALDGGIAAWREAGFPLEPSR